MTIKSLEELKKIREESTNKIKLRKLGEGKENNIEILVGMATCGIASGARETLNALTDEIAKENFENVKVIPVGCIGHCYAEPVIQVNIPGEKPVIYGKVDEQKGREIIKSHIKNRQPLKDSILDVDINRV